MLKVNALPLLLLENEIEHTHTHTHTPFETMQNNEFRQIQITSQYADRFSDYKLLSLECSFRNQHWHTTGLWGLVSTQHNMKQPHRPLLFHNAHTHTMSFCLNREAHEST